MLRIRKLWYIIHHDDCMKLAGYTFVKDLTLDVQNVVAPPKPKSLPVKNKSAFQDEKSTTVSSLDTNSKPEKISSDTESVEQHKDEFVKTPPDSPASVKSTESPSKIFRDSSPRAVNTKRCATKLVKNAI